MTDAPSVEEFLSNVGRKPLIYIHLHHGLDVERYRSDFLAGREPDETPYGFHLAAQEGFDVCFSRNLSRDGFLARLAWRLPDIDVLHAMNNRHRMAAADAIWTMTEGEAFAVAALMALRIIPRRPLIGNAIWLLNNWHKYGRIHHSIYRFLSKYIDIMTIHSVECLPIIRSVMPKMCSGLTYFGINTGLFKISPPVIHRHAGPLRLLAIGNDRTRDWDTMLEAFGNRSDFQVTMVCWWLSDEDLSSFDNVTNIRSPGMKEFLELYEETDMVLIPMKSNIFSGITVALEAAALGKPILASHTGGLPTYFEQDDLLYVPPGDPLAMREAALASTPESRLSQACRAQERFIERDYSTRAMIGRYSELTRKIFRKENICPGGP